MADAVVVEILLRSEATNPPKSGRAPMLEKDGGWQEFVDRLTGEMTQGKCTPEAMIELDWGDGVWQNVKTGSADMCS